MITAVYHWFDEPNDSPPYANLRVPIIISIATLRAVNPDIPIFVFAQYPRDWAHFPEKLNFTVDTVPFSYKRYEDRIKGWKHLSRIKDVHSAAPRGPIMYVDADVFWFRDPLPLEGDWNKFCFDGWNTGFYYYNRAEISPEFIDIFDSYTRAAIYSEEIRGILKKYVGYDDWYEVWDEMILTYMTHHHLELFDAILPEEHVTARTITKVDPNKVKMFHCNGTMVSNQVPKSPNEHIHCRGLLGIIIREFYELMQSVLTEEDLKQIYSARELAYYLPHQWSLLEDPHRLFRTKSEDGHFHVEKCRPQSRLI